LATKLQTNKEVLCVSSGTAAIHLALILAGVQKGDFVVCQSFTYIATVNPILYLGAIPIFIDSHPEIGNMDLDILNEAMQYLRQQGKNPKAIIVVNAYGIPSDINRLQSIASEYTLKLIEDSAESFGAKFQGNYSGTQAD